MIAMLRLPSHCERIPELVPGDAKQSRLTNALGSSSPRPHCRASRRHPQPRDDGGSAVHHQRIMF